MHVACCECVCVVRVFTSFRGADDGGVPALNYKCNHAVRRVSERIFNFANSMLGGGIGLYGQEALSLIEYRNEGDEYKAHCDGSCDGTAYRSGGRVATMLLYCKVAAEGGGTTFQRANIVVNPKEGEAVFFSYVGADNTYDRGLSEHSGCPIRKGRKLVVTQWLRKGVDHNDPHSNYDAHGNPVGATASHRPF